MDNLTQVGTLAGLIAITTALTGALKGLLGITGRWTQLTALIVALALSAAWMIQDSRGFSLPGIVLGACNAILAAAAAIGVHQSTVGIKE